MFDRRIAPKHRQTKFAVSRRSSRCSVGRAAAPLRVPNSQVTTSWSTPSLFLRASSALLLGGETPVGYSYLYMGNPIGDSAARLGNRHVTRAVSFGKTAAASGDSIEGVGSSALERSRKAARVTVRQAKERDYPGVAGIREVIIPVGMSGATGFMGGTVVIDSPVEAEKRLLMAKV